MKVFITGVAGFLGSHLADRMLELGHKVAGNDSLLGGYRDNVDPRVDFYEVDCCDYEKMTHIMNGADVVVHCAAAAHEGLSVFSPVFICENNLQATVSTITAAINKGVKRFVYCSSMARYGEQPTPYTEDQEPLPNDPYAVSKVAGEQVLKLLSETHGMEWNIAIPHNIVGPRQRYDDPYRNVMSIMINRNLQGQPSIIYGDGEQMRCFSNVEDCIFCLEKLALDPDIVYETVNIGPDQGTITINELAKKIAEHLDFHIPPVYHDARPREVKISHCSADKARRLLGYEPNADIDLAIRQTIEWIKERGPRPFDYSFPLEIINQKTPRTWKDRLL
jgi:UDP-glucose 4-epimerase